MPTLVYSGYKTNGFGAAVGASDPYFTYSNVSSSGTSASYTVSTIDFVEITSANTNGGSTSGYQMQIEINISGSWYAIGYIAVSSRLSGSYSFSTFVSTASSSVLSMMGKTAISGIRGKVTAGYFWVNQGSTITLMATTKVEVGACTPPTYVAFSQTSSTTSVTLSWYGATAGQNNTLIGHEVQYCDSPNGSSWGSWTYQGQYTLGINDTYIDPPSVSGYYRKCRVRAMGDSGVESYSTWRESSNTLRYPPGEVGPPVIPPVSTGPQPPYINVKGTTYCLKPYIRCTLSPHPNGYAQTLQLSIDNGATYFDVPNPNAYQLAAFSTYGTRTIKARVRDSLGAYSDAASATITTSSHNFTDPALIAGETQIKASHMNELRNVINASRYFYGLANYSWTESIVAATTGLKNWSEHINEMRGAINAITTLLGIPANSFIPIIENSPTTKVIDEMRIACKNQ